MFANIDDDVLMEKLCEIDQSLLNAAIKNQSAWWPGMKEKDEDWVSSHQSKVVKIQEDSRYPPKLKLKIINEGNKQATKFYVASQEEPEALMDANIESVTPGSKVVAMVSIQGAWISHHSMNFCFGLELRAEQILVYQPAETRGIHQFKLYNDDGQMLET